MPAPTPNTSAAADPLIPSQLYGYCDQWIRPGTDTQSRLARQIAPEHRFPLLADPSRSTPSWQLHPESTEKAYSALDLACVGAESWTGSDAEPPSAHRPAALMPLGEPKLWFNEVQVPCFGFRDDYSLNHHYRLPQLRDKALSLESLDAVSSSGSTLSPVQTDPSETLTSLHGWSCCESPGAMEDQSGSNALPTDEAALSSGLSEPNGAAKDAADGSFPCNWAGCQHANFASRDGLAWHVKEEHLFTCPVPGCVEVPFSNPRLVRSHMAVAHPELGGPKAQDWQLPPPATSKDSGQPTGKGKERTSRGYTKRKRAAEDIDSAIQISKKRCLSHLSAAVEKKAERRTSTRLNNKSPTDAFPSRATWALDDASFPLVFEHALLPFLAEFLPTWSGPRHVISVTRGRTPQVRRICIMTRSEMSRARKMIIAGHVWDLLPKKYRQCVSFIFSIGQVDRIACWARGLDADRPDDICSPRNPYHFQNPAMGDSIGMRGHDGIAESTATLGPCLEVNGGTYWLVNFHPFLEAHEASITIEVEHPSPQDRNPCLNEGHDALSEQDTFKIGRITVTSGLTLSTTRISHDPYWEELGAENPLVATDWALVAASTSTCGANILRRFPTEPQPAAQEPLIRSVSAGDGQATGVVPGAIVVSSGRTSGFQRGQICEIPAYVSGEENGTGKATREWFIEEPPPPWDDEEAWIRGGIGVSGDSGAAIVDAETNSLVGQVWGRNKYWGPGPRYTYFTPISDILDDIQEKCGIQNRPRLPQHRDDADCFPVYPSCRSCYDLRTYLESRRSSRATLHSMAMYAGDSDHDLTSVEAVSELATPRDSHRGTGFEEIGALFHDVASPAGLRLVHGDIRSPYPSSIEQDVDLSPRKRTRPSFDAMSPSGLPPGNPAKRCKATR